jgi:hypothetical protein
MSGLIFGLSYILTVVCFKKFFSELYVADSNLQLALPVYKKDVYRERFAASAFAAQNFIRFLLSAPFPLFTVQMVNNLGFGWAISLLGLITMAMIPIPFILHKWGPYLRARSRYVAIKEELTPQEPVQNPKSTRVVELGG